MTRVLIVGAGPSGIRAAETLARAGLRPMVVDEGQRAGGQIYRRPPEGDMRVPAALYGSEATKAVALHATFDRLVAEEQVLYRPRSSVVALADGVAHIAGSGGGARLSYDRLILATGAMDRLAPVPGWQVAGVYSLGAAQIALKAQGVAIGRRIVLAGSGPLLTLVADQLLHAGAGVVAVLDTAPLSVQALGTLAMATARPVVTARGLGMRLRLGRCYHAGVRLERIAAGSGGGAAVVWRDARGRERGTDCDAVAIGWHLRAETHLADLAGVRFRWSEPFRQWLPCADAMGRADGVSGIYLGGDGLALLGADGAEIAGRLAAVACLRDLELSHPDPVRDLRALARMRRFSRGVARAFPWPQAMVSDLPDETVICRCEGVTAGTLRETLSRSGPDANRAKALSRVGMGRCQGRYCQLAGAEVIAAAAGLDPSEVGRLRGQPPARPLPVRFQSGPEDPATAQSSA